MKKTNILTIILLLVVLVLSGYIVYDKVLSTEDDNNNYQENNNQNQDNNNNTNNNKQEDNIYEMKTTKIYAGCSKEAYQSNQVSFEYATYVLEIKEENKCVLHYGGIDVASSGNIMPYFDCVTKDSYVVINNNDIPLYFKINQDDTITYQNGNIVMKKVSSVDSVNYNFCKNNY